MNHAVQSLRHAKCFIMETVQLISSHLFTVCSKHKTNVVLVVRFIYNLNYRFSQQNFRLYSCIAFETLPQWTALWCMIYWKWSCLTIVLWRTVKYCALTCEKNAVLFEFQHIVPPLQTMMRLKWEKKHFCTTMQNFTTYSVHNGSTDKQLNLTTELALGLQLFVSDSETILPILTNGNKGSNQK